jgi:hypothetical protein
VRQHIFSKAVLGASLAASLMLMPVDAHAQAARRTPPRGGHVSGGGGGRVVTGPVYVARPVYRSYFYRPYYYRPYFYDPFYWGSWGWGPGWGIGLGYGYGWGWYPYGYGWGYPGYYGGYYGGRYSDARIEVTPKEAKVYVDGYYAGVVDDFDGWAQRLDVPPGQHEVEIYMPGYKTMSEQLFFQPGHTVKIKGTLDKLPAGAPPEPEPQPQAPPPGQQQYQQPGQPGQHPQQPPSTSSAPSPGPGPYGRPSRRAPQSSVRATNPSEFGTLSIRVQPTDAEIYVDGERWETGESQRGFSIQLAPGRHRVEVKKDGFRTFSTDVQVESGELTPLNVSLLSAREIE